MLSLLAGADSSTRGAATQVAVGLQPGDRAVEALPVVLIGLGELGGQTGELELFLIDLLPSADQLCGDRLAGSRRNSPDPSIHTRIVRTSVWRVKKILVLISDVANFEPPRKLFAWCEQRRRHRQVRPVAPTAGVHGPQTRASKTPCDFSQPPAWARHL